MGEEKAKVIHGRERPAQARTGCHYDMCNRTALVLPLCFLVKPQSSIRAEGWFSYSQRLVVCLTITSVSTATSETHLHCLAVHTARSKSLTLGSVSLDLSLCLGVKLGRPSLSFKVTVLIKQESSVLVKTMNLLPSQTLQTAQDKSIS